jgi:hypothetical protein
MSMVIASQPAFFGTISPKRDVAKIESQQHIAAMQS